MRDGVRLTQAGHPAVVFVYDNFERAARAQAKLLGAPDLRLYVYYREIDSKGSSSNDKEQAAVAVSRLPKLLVEPQTLCDE